MKKSIDQLSNDELYALLEYKPIGVEVDPTDVTLFIDSMKFESGNVLTPFSSIYGMYRHWSKTPTKRSTLGKELGLRFTKKETKLGVYYLMKRNGLSQRK